MKKPEKIGNILSSVLAEIGILDDIQQERLFIDWSEIVGETVSEYAIPVKLEDEKLWLKIEDPTWRTEIFNIRQILIEKINKKLGEKVVRKIVIV